MDRQVCHGLTRCFHLRCFRTSLGDATACRLSAKRNTRAAISKLPVVCAEDSSLAPSVPQQAKWIQVCRSTQSGNMNSRYNSWPDYPEILGDDFRARCNSLYLQPLGSTTPSLRSTDYHRFDLSSIFSAEGFSLVPRVLQHARRMQGMSGYPERTHEAEYATVDSTTPNLGGTFRAKFYS